MLAERRKNNVNGTTRENQWKESGRIRRIGFSVSIPKVECGECAWIGL